MSEGRKKTAKQTKKETSTPAKPTTKSTPTNTKPNNITSSAKSSETPATPVAPATTLTTVITPQESTKPKYTPGSYVPVTQKTYVSGKVWKQPKERFSAKKVRSKESYEEQMNKKREMKEIQELEAKIKADMEEENKIEKRKMEQRRQVRIEKIIKENKNKPLKQGRGKCKGRNKKLTDKDVHRVKIYHETQGLF